MNDNDLIRLFRPIIADGLIRAGYGDIPVIQSNQPTQQGINTGPTVYFYKVGDKRYGFLKRSDIWQPEFNSMTHIEEQWYETTFQINALVIQSPLMTSLPTASDLVNGVASIMQSDRTRAILELAGVGILRVMEVRNPYFVDDKDQFEASPSFDFILTHAQIIEDESPIANSIKFDTYRI